MNTPIDAVYQGGVLRPADPLPLADGTPVRVVVLLAAPAGSTPDEVRTRIRAIAALADSSGPPETTSIDHDKILYGDPHS